MARHVLRSTWRAMEIWRRTTSCNWRWKRSNKASPNKASRPTGLPDRRCIGNARTAHVSVSVEPNSVLGARGNGAAAAATASSLLSVYSVPDFIGRAVLALEVVALSVGVLQFVFAPSSVTRPLYAA